MSPTEILHHGAHSGHHRAFGSEAGTALFWAVMAVAVLFVGYLLVDWYLGWRRARRIQDLVDRSRREHWDA